MDQTVGAILRRSHIMKISTRVAAATLALSCLSAGAASAADRETFTVRVSQAGLDLHTEAGRRALEARVRRVAGWACLAPANVTDPRLEQKRCTDELLEDAARQVAMRLDGGTRLASLSH